MQRIRKPGSTAGWGENARQMTSRCKPASTVLFATLALVLLACGGSQGGSKKSYSKAISKQESCCNQLAEGPARTQCLEKVVRVDDPAVQEAPANRATYGCVERYFVCDSATGTATKESSQRQLDCINDISD